MDDGEGMVVEGLDRESEDAEEPAYSVDIFQCMETFIPID